MVSDELIDKAARAAFEAHHYAGPIGDEPIEWGRGGFKTEVMTWQAIARAVAPIFAEAFARVAEEQYRDHPATTVRAVNYRHAARRIAQAIRGEA